MEKNLAEDQKCFNWKRYHMEAVAQTSFVFILYVPGFLSSSTQPAWFQTNTTRYLTVQAF